MYPTDEQYKGIKRQEHPEWEGWKLIDRLKGIYHIYNDTILQRALDGDALLQEYVRDFYETNRDAGPFVQGEGRKAPRKAKGRDRT